MSTLWHKRSAADWTPHSLSAGEMCGGDSLGLPGIAVLAPKVGQRGAVLLVPAGAYVRVNGEPVLGGLRLLNDRDEVYLHGTRLCFSAESTPCPVRYVAVAGARLPICPICRGPVREGMQAVRCPGCGRWFHQLDAVEDRPARHCWSYAPSCRFCTHPTAFDAAVAWRPDQEDNRGG